MDKYNPAELEEKWQNKWEEGRLNEAADSDSVSKGKKKYYVLDMFPYPSGDGLHVGHFKGYTATDVVSRFLRMNGYNVLHPMGWDAFGLPAENYAIKTGVHPATTTKKNIDHIRSQMKSVGLSYDWSRELATTDKNYYKWTQWIFLQLYKAGLAYEDEAPINWCPKDKTGLANEEVVNGRCDRCGTPVVRKKIRQWVLAITKFADRLLEDLEGLDWPASVIEMQRNWIGRSEGTTIKFEIRNSKFEIRNKVTYIDVFTTRSDTLFGATYLVISPEHTAVSKILSGEWKVEIKQSLRSGDLGKLEEVEKYVKQAEEKTDLQRTDLAKEKTGVFSGLYAINPVSREEIPVWIADYVLSSYGTGAIMAVPAHDGRDFDFAKKFDLPIKQVIVAKKGGKPDGNKMKEAFVGYGYLTGSGKYNGLHSQEASASISKDLKKVGLASRKVSYRLRDWVFSRQRYWGEPIPIVHCPNCGTVPLDERDLPLLLPEVEKYQPTGTGESPLSAVESWVNTTCPNCGGPAKRETNTMPQWAGSCWYYLRFIDPKNDRELVSPSKEKYWMHPAGVDWYVGGAEHAVLHLLYARFWHKFLYDLGVVSTKEPFFKLRNVGLILGSDGQKMSKSRGNVVSPEEMITAYGADALRLFEMFVGPFGEVADWSPKGVEGVYRFVKRIWALAGEIVESGKKASDEEVLRRLAKLNRKVAGDILEMKFNTAVAAMMEFVNFASDHKGEAGNDVLKQFLLILAPFAPHLTEELYQQLQSQSLIASGKSQDGNGEPFDETQGKRKTINNEQGWSIHQQPWPHVDKKLLAEDKVMLVVEVNGKVRDRLEVAKGTGEDEVKKLALASDKVKTFIKGGPKKVIFVPDKLINFVV